MINRWKFVLVGLLIMTVGVLPVKMQSDEITPYILFVSKAQDNEEIFILDWSTGQARNLTNNTARNWHPTWSGDGTHIAYNSDQDENEEVYVMQANGLDQTNISRSSGRDLSPDWSPVADEIVFMSDRDGGFDLYIANVESGEIRRLTTDGVVKSEPDWSPDGSQIVYWQEQDASLLNIVNVADGTVSTLAADGQYLWPAWSPDGTKIAYYAQIDGVADIFTIDIASGAITQLTQNAGNNARPDWSPDGSQIVFMSDRDGNFNLYTINPDGENPQRLTDRTEDDTSAAWQPVPAEIDFAANPAVGLGVYRVNESEIDLGLQGALGNWDSQVLAPTQANYQDKFFVRLEVIPPTVDASTPVPGSTVQESAQITAYTFMGAELVGLDLEMFDITPNDTRYLLNIRDDEVNYWEWELRAKDRNAAGLRSFGVRLFVPAILSNGIEVEEEIKTFYVNVEIIPGQATDAASLTFVRSVESEATQGFSVIADENTLAILFSTPTNVEDMSISTSWMDIIVQDIFPDFEESDNQAGANTCIYFVREGREPTLPSECDPQQTFDHSLIAGDVFWHDGVELVGINIRKNNTIFSCPAETDRCDF